MRLLLRRVVVRYLGGVSWYEAKHGNSQWCMVGDQSCYKRILFYTLSIILKIILCIVTPLTYFLLFPYIGDAFYFRDTKTEAICLDLFIILYLTEMDV